MLTTYTRIPAADLRPGMTITTTDGPLVVGEIRHLFDALDVYGTPPGSDRRTRLRFTFKPDEEVRRIPDPVELAEAWASLTAAVESAAATWTQDGRSTPPWRVDGHRIYVTVGGGPGGPEFMLTVDADHLIASLPSAGVVTPLAGLQGTED